MPKVPEKLWIKWEEDVIPVKHSKTGIIEEVPSWVYGTLGIHVSVDPGKTDYVLTHIPSGFSCCYCVREECCKNVGFMLLTKPVVRDAIKLSSNIEVVRALPNWTKPWLFAVTKELKYIDPMPYIVKFK